LTDTDTGVLIKRRTKLNILRFLLITKQTLSRFVKALGDMFKGVWCAVFGTAKLIWRADEGTLPVNGVENYSPSRNARALRLTKTEPAKTPGTRKL
jgi:hypothetical protein